MNWVAVWRATFLTVLRWMQYLANLLEGNQLGRTVVMLAELADTGEVGLFGAGADGQELQIIAEGF